MVCLLHDKPLLAGMMYNETSFNTISPAVLAPYESAADAAAAAAAGQATT
jgi:hypothetical protein